MNGYTNLQVRLDMSWPEILLYINTKNMQNVSQNFEGSRNIRICATHILSFTKDSLYVGHTELRIVSGIIHTGFITIGLCLKHEMAFRNFPLKQQYKCCKTMWTMWDPNQLFTI